jgi:ribonucleotide reductase beta subunit family protein with ferritin-like domain
MVDTTSIPHETQKQPMAQQVSASATQKATVVALLRRMLDIGSIHGVEHADERLNRVADLFGDVDAEHLISTIILTSDVVKIMMGGSVSFNAPLPQIAAASLPRQLATPRPAEAKFRWDPREVGRIAIMPILHEDIWQFRKTLEALHWTAQEVDLTRDAADWARLSQDERDFVSKQLAFFAGADLWVLRGIEEFFSKEVDCLEAKMAYAAQADQECTHTEAYNLQIEAVMSGEERDRALNAAENMPAIAKMRDWAYGWMNDSVPTGNRLVAAAVFEGVLFSASFASFQWMRDRNVLPGITEYNALIARDEGIHTLHTGLYVRKYLIERPSIKDAQAIFESAIETLDEFIEHSLPVRLIGMNLDLMKQYVRFQANCVYSELGYKGVIYRGAPNPFPTMDKLTLNGIAKTNFFERRGSQYQNVVAPGASRLALDETPVEDE